MFKEDIIFIVGNGESRKDFDLNTLRGRGLIIGCNALYRDFEPDILIVRDHNMRKEVIESGYSGFVPKFEQGRMGSPDGASWLDIPPSLILSGTVAMHYARNFFPARLFFFLLGFDPYSLDGKKNNIYTGTQNYEDQDEDPAPRINAALKDFETVQNLYPTGWICYTVTTNPDKVPLYFMPVSYPFFEKLLSQIK